MEDRRPLVVYVYAKWCKHCDHSFIEKVFDSLRGKAIFLKVDGTLNEVQSNNIFIRLKIKRSIIFLPFY